MPVMKRLTVDGVNYDTVGEASVTQVQTSGTKIATVTIDGTATDLYAPEGGGGGPEPSSTTPAMDGTAAVGTATTYARADHVHPTDTSRQATLVSGTNIKTINGASILGSGDIATPTYTLPTASTSTLGGVKVDGSTITITDGVISSSGGGGGGGGDAYVIGMTLSGTTVSNVTYPTGESVTTIATAIMDDPSTRVVFSLDVGASVSVMNCTPCSLQARANPVYGDVAARIEAVIPVWFEDKGGDRTTYLLRLYYGSGSWYAQTRTTI